MAVTTGYYIVQNAYNGQLLDVNGGSQANGASVVDGVSSNENSQIMHVVEEGEGVLLYPVHTERLDDQSQHVYDPKPRFGVATSSDINDSLVFLSNGWGQSSDNDLWILESTDDSVVVNGVSYPAYRVKTAFVDTSQEDHILTPPKVNGRQSCTVYTPYESTYGSINLAQEWAFIPSVPFDSDLPVPSYGTTGSPEWRAGNTTTSVVMFNDDTGTVRPNWESKGSAHQLRWRRRDRSETAETIGDWSNWTAWGGDGSSDGWGIDPTTATSGIEKRSRIFYPSTGLSVDFTGSTIRTEIEWNIRVIDTAAPAVGGVYGFTSVVVRNFKITSVTCTKIPNGLYVSFTTSYPEDMVQTAAVESTDGTFTRASVNDSTTVFVKNSLISVMPNIGDTIDITLTATSTDGYSATWNGTVEVELGGSFGTPPTVTCTVNGTIATIQADAPDNMHLAGAWLVVPRGHGDRYVDLGGLESLYGETTVRQTWVIPPPLGVPWSVLVSVAANSGGDWGYDATVRDPIIEEPPSYHITSRNCKKDFAVTLRKTAPGPSFTPTYTRSRNETETYSRERPVYGYSDTTKAEWQLIGDLIDGNGLSGADWAAHESHVYFRSPHGFWAQCAVNSLRIDLTSTQSQEVQANFSEEVW